MRDPVMQTVIVTTGRYFNWDPSVTLRSPLHRGAGSIMTQGKVMGPVDYLMIKFPGNKFSGKAAPELLKLEKKGIIRVIDMVFIVKDENGNW